VLTRTHDAAKVCTADCCFELGPIRLDEVLEWNNGVETSSVVLVSRAIVCVALLHVVPSHSDDSHSELMDTQSSAQHAQATTVRCKNVTALYECATYMSEDCI
jgi:hypothetical protein